MSGKRVVIISVKPLRPTVTGARVLFDNIVTYLSAHDGYDVAVMVAGPLTEQERAATASIGPSVALGPASPSRRRGLLALLRERPPLRLRFVWFEDAAASFARLIDASGPADDVVVVALGIDSAAAALCTGRRVDVVVVPSLEADAPDAEFPGLERRPLGRLLAGRLSRYDRRARCRHERSVLDSIDHIVVSTPDDAEDLAQMAVHAEVSTIPHGVPAHLAAVERRTDAHRPPTGLFVGAMSYGPNLDAVAIASRVIERVRITAPEAVIRVAGLLPPGFPTTQFLPAVQFLGPVNDVTTAYEEAAFVLAPLRHGGGGRIKVIEALAAGVPLITTSTGVAGLGVVAGEHVWLADTDAEMAAAVTEVLSDPAAASAQAERGRRWVFAELGPEAIARHWIALVDSVPPAGATSNTP